MRIDAYKTSDFPTAAALLVRRHRILEVNRENPRRVVFSFENTSALKKDTELLQKRQLLVDPMDFWAAERRCKQLLYGEEGSL